MRDQSNGIHKLKINLQTFMFIIRMWSYIQLYKHSGSVHMITNQLVKQ